MSTGAAYGSGIYLGADSSTSFGYAGTVGGWSQSIYGTSCTCVAVCEVINAGYSANPYYVVPVEDHVVTRYLLVYNASNSHQHNTAAQLRLPQTRYTAFMNQSEDTGSKKK